MGCLLEHRSILDLLGLGRNATIGFAAKHQTIWFRTEYSGSIQELMNVIGKQALHIAYALRAVVKSCKLTSVRNTDPVVTVCLAPE